MRLGIAVADNECNGVNGEIVMAMITINVDPFGVLRSCRLVWRYVMAIGEHIGWCFSVS